MKTGKRSSFKISNKFRKWWVAATKYKYLNTHIYRFWWNANFNLLNEYGKFAVFMCCVWWVGHSLSAQMDPSISYATFSTWYMAAVKVYIRIGFLSRYRFPFFVVATEHVVKNSLGPHSTPAIQTFFCVWLNVPHKEI